MMRSTSAYGLWALTLALALGLFGPPSQGADTVPQPAPAQVAPGVIVEAIADAVADRAAADEAVPEATPADKPADNNPANDKPAEGAKPGEAAPTPGEKPAADPANGDKPTEPAPPAKPREPRIDPAELVKQLGNEEYKVRRDAAEKLTEQGLDARDALLVGLKFPDPEVRRACRRILSGVLEADFQGRLKAFIDDTEGKQVHDLPGWERYRATIGDDKPSRELFVDMLRAESGLMATADAGDSQTGEALELRFRQVYQAMYTPDPRSRKQPEVGSIAALLFVLADPRVNLANNQVDNMFLPQIIYHQSFQQMLNGPKSTPAARKLVGGWIRRPSGQNMMPQKLSLAMQYNLKEDGLALAVHVLQKEKNIIPAYKAHAVMALGKLGGKEYAQLLAELLADTGVCMQQVINNKRINVEIRDVALGWLVFVTDQDLAEYGMPAAKQAFEQMKKYPQYQVNYTFMKFDSPEKRDEALKKWREWVEKNPLPAPPAEPAATPGDQPADKPAPNAGGNANPGNANPGIAIRGIAAPAIAPAANGARPANNANNGPAKPPKAEDANGEKQPAEKKDEKKEDAAKDANAKDEAAPAQKGAAVQGNVRAVAAGKIAAIAGAIAQVKGQEEGTKDEERLEVGGGLRRADRLESQKLLEARRLIAAKEYVDATAILGEILLQDVDYAFQPDRGIALYRGFKTEAERLLSELPLAGLEAYEFQFQPQAQRQLKAAIESGDMNALARVVESFFYTPAGAEATYLLGVRYRLEGEPLRAGLYFARLRSRHRAAKDYEPELSLQLAVAWAKSGLDAPAQDVLRELFQRRGPINVVRDETENPLPNDPAAALQRLAGDVGPFPNIHDTSPWAMHRGNAARNASTALGLPYLTGAPLAPFTSDRFLGEQIKELRDNQLKRKTVSIPSFSPLVVGERIVLRTATHVQAFDIATGEMAWESGFDDSLRSLALMQDDEQKKRMADSIKRGLERRLWNDAAFGAMSSNGSLIFGVESLPFEVAPDFQRRVVASDGKMRLDLGGVTRSNTLVAYDLKSGKLRWELGGPGEPILGDAYFLAAPLPLAGRLYAVAIVKNDETHLLELDPATGRLVARMVIDEKNELATIDPRFRFNPYMQQMRQYPRTTASPASADGVLICPTSENRYVAIDLTARKVLWVFDGPNDDTGLVGKQMAMMQFGFAPQSLGEDNDRGDRWNDASPIIGDGYVVLTPRRSGAIFCLSLASGNLLWQDSRRDGLYAAGVHDGKVVVVGRSNVWALRLADGTSAWEQGSLALPPGSFTCGRGLLAEHDYLLPLTSAEVAAIDLATGRLVARSRSPGGMTAGNLIAGREHLITQSLDGLWRLPTLAGRLADTAAALAAAPESPAALADRGEALLCAGQVADAVGCLRTAWTKEQSPRTRQLLLDALAQGLRTDVAAFQQVAQEFDKLADQAERRDEFLKQIAVALQGSGQRDAAFAAYLKLVDLDRTNFPLEPESAATDVRRDRWVQARLWDLRSSSPPEFQAKIDQEIASRLRDDKLRPFLAYFGCFPIAHQARLTLAKQLVEQKQWHEAEILLRQIATNGPETMRPEATARLAAMLRESAAPMAAALVYAHLGGPLADVVCLDGKKGRELLAAVPADDPLRRWLDPASVWPRGSVKKESAAGGGNSQYRYTLPTVHESGPFAQSLPLDIDPGGSNLVGYDVYGRQRFSVQVPMPQNGNNKWSMNGTIYSYSQSRLSGHSLFVWMGNRIAAIATQPSGARVVWTSNTIVSEPPFPQMMRMFPFGMQQFRQPEVLPCTRPQMLVAANGYVCFQQEQTLVAVDPLTGATLWSRDGCDEDCDLIGDEEFILITSGSQRETLVLSALDGREVARRPAVGSDQRMAIFGRHVVLWEKIDGKSILRMVDAFTGQNVWKNEYAEAAFPWQCAAEEVGVYQDDGEFRVVSLLDGSNKLAVKTEAPAELQDVIVQRNGNNYLLMANRPPDQRRDGMNLMFFPQQFPGSMLFNGSVRAIDRTTGKQVWITEIKDQMFRVDQPSELPILAFCAQVHKTDGRTSNVFERQVCLDKRNGAVLHDEQGGATGGAQYQIVGDPDTGKMELRLPQKKYTFTLQPEGK